MTDCDINSYKCKCTYNCTAVALFLLWHWKSLLNAISWTQFKVCSFDRQTHKKIIFKLTCALKTTGTWQRKEHSFFSFVLFLILVDGHSHLHYKRMRPIWRSLVCWMCWMSYCSQWLIYRQPSSMRVVSILKRYCGTFCETRQKAETTMHCLLAILRQEFILSDLISLSLFSMKMTKLNFSFYLFILLTIVDYIFKCKLPKCVFVFLNLHHVTRVRIQLKLISRVCKIFDISNWFC